MACDDIPVELRIARLAGRQHGVVSRQQLKAAGLSDDQVDRWAARGRLHRLFRGVYAVGIREVVPLGTAMAAVLATGGVLSHRSAADLWGIRPHTGRPEVTVRRSGARRREDLAVHVSRTLTATDTTLLQGIPVTTPARTLVDLADVLTATGQRRALARAERAGLVDRDQLVTPPGRRTVVRGGHVLTRSAFEDRFERAVRAWGLPVPLMNQDVLGMEVDAYWPDRGLVVELDHPHTHLNPASFEWDRLKQERLEDAGLRVRRITERRFRERPLEVRAALARALGPG